MPRRPREVQLLIESSNHPVSEHLKKEFWRMKEELNESHALSVQTHSSVGSVHCCCPAVT